MSVIDNVFVAVQITFDFVILNSYAVWLNSLDGLRLWDTVWLSCANPA